MNVLYLRAYFEPEQVASSHLELDLIDGYRERNLKTIIWTPTPTRGVSKEVQDEYKNRKYETIHDEWVVVKRFSLFREGHNPVQRALRYLLCNIAEYHKGIHEKGIDLVHCGSTPPTQGMLSALVAKKLSKQYGRKVPFVYNLQDVFPDSLVNAGMTKKGSLIWKLGRKIENYTYEHADKIIVISEGFKRNIMGKGVPEEKIVVVSNWADLDAVKPVERQSNSLFDELRIDRSEFIAVYAGNLGEAQGADVIIDAAKELINNPNIQFVVFGGGARYQELKDRVEKENVSNVFITDLQPQERVSEAYSMGSVALITCKPGTGNAGMPSKTWSIMACNTPIIASFDTESDLAEVLKKSGAGICVEPGNATALAGAIKDAYEKWKNEGKSSLDTRTYAIQNASKEICVKKYIDTLLSVAK